LHNERHLCGVRAIGFSQVNRERQNVDATLTAFIAAVDHVVVISNVYNC
jgi:hypothetical protein